MAAIDPVSWLRATPPFSALPAALLEGAARTVEETFHPAGTRLVRLGEPPLEHLYLIRKGAVRLERNGQTLGILEEGEVFGYLSLLTGRTTLDVVVEEDLAAYRLPASEFRNLMRNPAFAGHFAESTAARLRSSLEQASAPFVQPDLGLEVRHLAVTGPAWVDAAATVGDTAKLMRERHVRSALVRSQPPGIVTDRDFQNRVLAEDRGPECPVREVMSRPLKTIPATTPVYEAWRLLLEFGVHHLPLTADSGEIVAMITATDLLRHTATNPLSILWRVQRLASRDDLAGYAQRIAEMTSGLVAGRLEPSVIAGFVARLNDALVGRILRWTEAELGGAPAPYAWIVFGSEGRMEQTLLTDQDNALVYSDDGRAHGDWFARFADGVNVDLERAGFPECPGGYMARKWHGPLATWMEHFRGWIDVPTQQALLEAAIFFDFRKVGGELDLEPLEKVVIGAAERPLFVRWTAKNALEFRPPAMPMLRLRAEPATVDLKHHGISPVVGMARCYALEHASRARNTIERLEASAAALGEAWDAVIEGYRFLLAMRLRKQIRSTAEGRAPSNEVTLSELSALERSRLKESFRAIRAWQDQAAHHFHADF